MSDHTIDDRIGEIEARAKRRYRVRLPLVLLVAVPIGVGVGRLGGGGHHRTHHHHGPLGLAIGFVVIVAGVAVCWFLIRRRGSWKQSFRPSLLLGLARPDRKRALRGLRRGTPDDEVLLREVQVRSAHRLVRQSRHTKWLFPLLIVTQAVVAVLNADNGYQWVYFAATAVLFAILLPWSILLVRRACTLLETVRDRAD